MSRRAVGANGLSATQIMSLHKAPLYSVDGFSVVDGAVDISGLVLAPGGDPRRVSASRESRALCRGARRRHARRHRGGKPFAPALGARFHRLRGIQDPGMGLLEQ